MVDRLGGDVKNAPVRRRLLGLLLLFAIAAAPATAEARGKGPRGKAGASLAKAGRSAKRPTRKGPRFPAITLAHVSTEERFVLRPDARGRLGGKRLKGLDRFLRCHHTGARHALSPRLPQILYAAAHHFGDRPVSIVAGYRAPRIAKQKGNPRSPHRLGRACDFRIDGVKLADLRDYLRRSFGPVGVGYYPNANFVHVDVGRQKAAYWLDDSPPGGRVRLAAQPKAAPDDDDDEGLGEAIARSHDDARAAP